MDVLFGEDKLAVIVATFVRSRIQTVDTVVALQDVGRQRCCSNVWWWCLFFFLKVKDQMGGWRVFNCDLGRRTKNNHNEITISPRDAARR